MFGYIRPLKPQLRICEYDSYKAVYCGLCKQMGKSFNFLLRFSLSYDFAFLGLLNLSLSDEKVCFKNEVCIAHPFKKTPCLECGHLEYTANTAVISIYHKIKDDISDRGFFKKILSFLLMILLKRSYNKAKTKLPQLAEVTERYMTLQNKIENEKTKSIDLAAEPTAQIMSEIAKGLSENSTTKRVLSRVGYLLGRYVYLIDALDDVEEDFKKHNYNPLLLQDDCENGDIVKIKDIAKESIMFTLGELANAYTLLEIKKFKPILDNIVYLGLNNTLNSVLNIKERKNERSI